MSASQENGCNSVRYEIPRTPSSFDELKALILGEIFAHFPDVNLQLEDVANTTTTFKEVAGKRVLTSLVVTLKQSVLIGTEGNKQHINYLRWHYQDGVGVSDNQLLVDLMGSHNLLAQDVTWVKTLPQAPIVASANNISSGTKLPLNMIHELILTFSEQQPEIQSYLLGFLHYLRGIKGTKPLNVTPS